MIFYRFKKRNRQYLINIGKDSILVLEYRLTGTNSKLVHKIFYNEEFDPGSGWTLATGLTHASRGASGI